MTDDSPQLTAWWNTFFDHTYAEFGLAAPDPEKIGRTVDFLFEVLGLREGMHLFDQCCGIGRLSVPLARRGIHVIGVDITAGYVDRARAEARELPAEFHCADAFEFVTDRHCDAAVNWFTSFGYSESDQVNARMFERAFAS
ncbi:MAG: class I SAM-dependent methyltransferase, partial [Planctomycetota bacterium]